MAGKQDPPVRAQVTLRHSGPIGPDVVELLEAFGPGNIWALIIVAFIHPDSRPNGEGDQMIAVCHRLEDPEQYWLYKREFRPVRDAMNFLDGPMHTITIHYDDPITIMEAFVKDIRYATDRLSTLLASAQ
jgi:hypothetical protein